MLDTPWATVYLLSMTQELNAPKSADHDDIYGILAFRSARADARNCQSFRITPAEARRICADAEELKLLRAAQPRPTVQVIRGRSALPTPRQLVLLLLVAAGALCLGDCLGSHLPIGVVDVLR